MSEHIYELIKSNTQYRGIFTLLILTVSYNKHNEDID